MRRLLYILLITTLVSCEISDSVEVTINYRPSLLGIYSYIDSTGIECSKERMDSVMAWVFSENDKLIAECIVPNIDINNDQGIFFLDGVPEGKYRLVSFGNACSQLVEMNPSKSWKGHDICLGKSGDTITDGYPLFYHEKTFQVERGDRIKREFQVRNVHCIVSLKLRSEMNINVEDFQFSLCGLPSSIGFDGNNNDECLMIRPQLVQKNSNTITAQFNSLRPTLQNEVLLQLNIFENNKLKTTYKKSINEYLETLDLSSGKDILIPIIIDLNNKILNISIEEWETTAPPQHVDVG